MFYNKYTMQNNKNIVFYFFIACIKIANYFLFLQVHFSVMTLVNR